VDREIGAIKKGVPSPSLLKRMGARQQTRTASAFIYALKQIDQGRTVVDLNPEKAENYFGISSHS